jgi:hypothetical protein
MAALCVAAAAQPLEAQGTIRAGQTVSGRLDASDFVRDSDNTYYDDWFYEGRAGEQITVTQRSSDFDSWLLIGRVVNGEFQLDEFNDDDAGGNDARIEITLPTTGRYVIRVNVVGRGRTGAYTLSLSSASGSSGGSSGGNVLSAGQSFTGALESSDPLWTDNTHYDLWRYRGRAGERVTIIMRSPSFNSYMQYGRLNGNEFSYLGGSTSRTIGGQQETVLDITLPETGEYGIRANSHGRHTGEYVLTVSSSGASAIIPAPSSSARTIAVGSTIRGSLTPADAQTDSGWYHEDYTFSGSARQMIQVDLQSEEFDTFIDLYQGTRWVAEDDDGGDGLDSRLVYTLPESGTFTICVRSRYANRTGSYTLSLR